MIVSRSQKQALACIRVTDTGRGIPGDKVETIFEPFVRVDRELTPTGQQGVGLGLAISRDLARAMGGDTASKALPAAVRRSP